MGYRKNLGGKRVELSDGKAARQRREIGVVFQSFHLIPTMTALENVATPLELAGVADAFERAEAELVAVGLAERMHHYPSQMSGGEQQRVAVARALINSPAVVSADEPSGNLDSGSSEELHKLLFRLRDDLCQSFIIVTHSEELARLSDRRLVMVDGVL